jgi:translation initiation factor IF-2
MMLSELAKEHNLETDLLRGVVEEDLSIPLPKGMATELKPAEVKRILACDGLETVDGKAFKPIIAQDFIEKHNRSQAAKKAANTRKAKVAIESAAKAKEAETKTAAELAKHNVELSRRRTEEEARAIAEEAAAKIRAEEEARLAGEKELARQAAEVELQRRESEARRVSAELAAMKHRPAPAPVVTPAPVAAAPTATAAPAAPVVAAPAPVMAKANETVAAAPVVAASTPVAAAPAAPSAPVAPVAKVEKPAPAPIIEKALPKAVSGLGSRLASVAKATHDKADHTAKVVPKPAAALPASQEALSPEERRRLIQAQIAKNLQMADRQKKAKENARKVFKPIDRTKTPGPPSSQRSGPRPPGGGPARPAGPPGPKANKGPKRDNKDHRTEQEIAEEAAGKSRRWKSTLDEDISGVTEFDIALPCTLREFSEASGVKSSIIIAKLLMAGVMANVNSVLEKDAIELLAQEFKKTVHITEAKDKAAEVEEQQAEVVDKPEDLAPRPPVVTIMGHVDHGKTSLLDAIRKTNLTAGEAGGITQHIGAYTVTTPSGFDVTFIDTPGHQAFTEMRARGAQITDVAVIVVAADDGVMPQTVEAINHAKAAGVTIVVAMNKIDKPGIDRDKILHQLSAAGLTPEEWGGDTAIIGTSATTGAGLSELLDRLALETDVLELKANHFANASGIVIEANRHEGKGVTATLLVRRGSLAVGDVVLAGVGYGKVRNMIDWKGDVIDLAGPSHAVEIIGLNDMPRAGDRFLVMDKLTEAAEAAEARRQTQRERELTARQKTTTAASIFGDIAHSKKKEVRLVVKADAAGSLEVLNKTISDLATEEVRVTIIHGGVGGINASDVTLAEASKAMIIGFHVIADSKARALADQHGLDIRIYTIIYNLLDELKLAMSGLLDPELRDTIIGHADVRASFQITKVGTVAGLYVTDGVVRRDAFMRITRDHKILHTGKVGSLRRFKEDVKEVKQDFECGLTIENFQDVKVGDVMEFFSREKVARTI